MTDTPWIMKQTRIKLTLWLIVLIFAMSIIKHFLRGIPFETAVAAAVAIAGWYLDRKTKDNISRVNGGEGGER